MHFTSYRYRKRRDSSRHSDSSEESDKENDRKSKSAKRKKILRKKPTAVPATAEVNTSQEYILSA